MEVVELFFKRRKSVGEASTYGARLLASSSLAWRMRLSDVKDTVTPWLAPGARTTVTPSGASQRTKGCGLRPQPKPGAVRTAARSALAAHNPRRSNEKRRDIE